MSVSEEREHCKWLGLLIGEKYRVVEKIGAGSFGDVYSGRNIETGVEVAIKFECKKTIGDHLFNEKCVYQQLKGSRSVPRLHWYGSEGTCNVMVMQLLGKSLEKHFKDCQRQFSLKTVLMLADQMLQRVQHLHANHYIHRDLKPDNFVMGLGTEANRVYIIDFGLAKKYRDRYNVHISCRNGRPLTGTIRYASLGTHAGVEQSRRDDLESLGYVFMYFNRGSLPWQGLRARNKIQHIEMVAEKKMSTTIKELCKGYPQAFAIYLRTCRDLRFDEAPKYNFLRQLFADKLKRLHYKNDYAFDWKFLDNRVPDRASAMNSPAQAKANAPVAAAATDSKALQEEDTSKQQPDKPQQYISTYLDKSKVSCQQVLLDPKVLQEPPKSNLVKPSLPMAHKYMTPRLNTAQVEQPQAAGNILSNTAIRESVQRSEFRGAAAAVAIGTTVQSRRRKGQFLENLIHAIKAQGTHRVKKVCPKVVAGQSQEVMKDEHRN